MMGQSLSNPLIPRDYKVLGHLGAGAFGVVVKCMKKDTKEIVALKIPRGGSMDNELALMTYFKERNLDNFNIVRFIGPITLTNNTTALAYESLDVTLRYYISGNANTRLNVHNIRSVVQQLASALNALKSISVIHADIKFDNIMLVDRNEQPPRVKLIDFGLALSSTSARRGEQCQVTCYRAPEIFLGLPFSESIDMWSLGVVMARLVLGRMIFPGITDYYVLQHIVDFLGVPSAHLLTAGKYSNRFFVRGLFSEWRLKTYEEFWGPVNVPDSGRIYRINTPDCLETCQMEPLKVVEAAEREECIDLLKAMLRMDANERITPSQVLAHPFIRRGNLHHRSDSGSDSECHESAAAQIPPGVILVQPAPPECRLALAEDSRQRETSCSMHEASTPPPQSPFVSISSEYVSWSGSDSECHESAAAQIPPGVILVQPAPPECRLAFNKDTRQSETSWLGSDSECLKPAAAQIPPGVILVQPAPPECRLALAEDSRQRETSCLLDLLEELSENSSVEFPSHLAEDTETTDIALVPQKRKERKKKNPFKRLWVWAKETFTSRNSVDAES